MEEEEENDDARGGERRRKDLKTVGVATQASFSGAGIEVVL